MAGLDTRGLASGFTQGFGMADQYYARQHQQGLQDDRNDRSERRFDMAEQQFEGQQEDAQRQRNQQQAQLTLGKIAQGVDLSDDEMDFMRENPKYWGALDPEMDAAIENAQRVIDPDDPMGSNDPEALYSMNLMFGHRVNRGEGGKKRIAGLYPGQQEGTVALDLEVEGEDGEKYNAPMTKNRGTKGDDEVLQAPVEGLVNQVQGYRVLRNVFRGPEAQQNASKVLAALTGKQAEAQEAWSEPFEYQGGFYQRSSKSGELREVQSPDTVRKGSTQGADLSGQQKIYAKRLQSEVDHLWRMERQIQTGQSDGMNIFLGGMEETVTPGNKDQLLSDIRGRIQANEQELNKLMGASAPQQGYDALLQEAKSVPEDQREKELSDLKNNPRVPYTVVRQIEEMWGMGSRAPKPEPEPNTEPQPAARPGLQEPAAAPGEAKASATTATKPEPQQLGITPPANEKLEPKPSKSRKKVDPQYDNTDKQFMDKKLGPAIESGAKAVGKAVSKQADKNINATTRELSQIAKGEREPYQGNIRQMLTNSPEAVKRLSPADLQRLQQKYGEQFINQFL